MSRAPKYHPDSNAYAMSSYLHYHPQVAQALELNSALSTDPTFLQSHPQFRAFLQKHPVVQRRLATRGWDFQQWQRYHQWNQRAEWRDADDWSDRDWHEHHDNGTESVRRHHGGGHGDHHKDHDKHHGDDN